MPGVNRNSLVTPSAQERSAQRHRRPRTSKPKVKTGCTNCKLRRIKCDEQRPSCTQCVRSKKNCTGYPPPPRSQMVGEIKIAPRPNGALISPAPTAIAPLRIAAAPTQVRKLSPARGLTPPQTPITSAVALYRPSINLPFDPLEGLYFQLFREQTASELSGFFDYTFWTRSVMQACHSEESIRHAVVALGALYKTLEKMTESPPSSPTGTFDPTEVAVSHWEVAVHHYSLALKAMVAQTTQDQSTETQRSGLMATVLLACFDSFVGDHKQAIIQIQNGLRLLEKLRAERRSAFLPKPEEPVEQDLIQMFTRLAIQAKSYDMAFHFPQPYVIRLTQNTDPTSPSSDGGSPVSTNQNPIPERFSSLAEARVAWDSLCEKIFRFTETMFQHTSSISPMGTLPMSLKQYGASFSSELEAWSAAFDDILISRNAPGKSTQEKTAISVLKMFQIMSQILFAMTFKVSESGFDLFLTHFKDIVSLATEVVGDEEREAAAKRCPDPRLCQHGSHHEPMLSEYTARHIKPSFSADLGIVPPLYVVATKCRDPMTRRRAIDLLRSSSRREGMWDSDLAARIGLWITGIEEAGAVEVEESPRPTTSSTGRFSISMGSPGARSNGSIDFGDDTPLGPGGNARWGSRRESTPTTANIRSETTYIPEDRRVMVRAVEFDLRERFATLKCGTRNLTPGMPDSKTRVASFRW